MLCALNFVALRRLNFFCLQGYITISSVCGTFSVNVHALDIGTQDLLQWKLLRLFWYWNRDKVKKFQFWNQNNCLIKRHVFIKPGSHIAVTCRRLPPALLLRYAAGSLFLMWTLCPRQPAAACGTVKKVELCSTFPAITVPPARQKSYVNIVPAVACGIYCMQIVMWRWFTHRDNRIIDFITLWVDQ